MGSYRLLPAGRGEHARADAQHAHGYYTDMTQPYKPTCCKNPLKIGDAAPRAPLSAVTASGRMPHYFSTRARRHYVHVSTSGPPRKLVARMVRYAPVPSWGASLWLSASLLHVLILMT
eukprot:scaffold14984_cov124-Isochrysis_galbana.AAC.1